MGKKGIFATLFVILVLVFLLFPRSTGTEHFLLPERVVNLGELGKSASSGSRGTVSFSLGDHFGYFTDEMALTYWAERDYRVAISDSSFINYPKIPSVLDIQQSNGEGRAIIETTGYPLLAEDKIVVLSDSFISLYDLDGNLFWKKEILSFVTTISVNSDHVLIGYLDGLCELISMSGQVILSYRPGGSRIESIYSSALSEDGQHIALISGLDPQRFILLQKRKEEFKPVHHFELDHQYRRTIDMYFSDDDSRVFFESPQGIKVFTVLTRDMNSLGGGGRLEKIYLDRDDGFYSLLVKEDSSARLQVLTPENRTLLDRSFSGSQYYFRKNDENFYIGADNRLMYLRMVNN